MILWLYYMHFNTLQPVSMLMFHSWQLSAKIIFIKLIYITLYLIFCGCLYNVQEREIIVYIMVVLWIREQLGFDFFLQNLNSYTKGVSNVLRDTWNIVWIYSIK
jgi:hypothetical protein